MEWVVREQHQYLARFIQVSNWTYLDPVTPPSDSGASHPLHGGHLNCAFQDLAPWNFINSGMPYQRVQLYAEMLGGGDLDAVQDVFPACRLGLHSTPWSWTNYGNYSCFVPAAQFPDLWKWNGAHANESLFLVAPYLLEPVASAGNHLAEALDAAADPATLTLDTTAGLAPSGYVSLEGEVLRYTGSRVGRGGCPPRPPSDPGMRDYRTRLFRSRVRCVFQA